MELELSIWDALELKLMRYPGKNFEITLSEPNILNVRECDEDIILFTETLKKKSLLSTLAKKGKAHVVYKDGQSLIYMEKVKIFLGTVEYIGKNQYGSAKLCINGRDCNTIQSISRAVFGVNKSPDYVREFIKPYYKEETLELRDLDIDLRDFELVETKKLMGKYYPVISYRGTDYSGVTKLKEALPQLEDERLLKQVYEQIGWEPSKAKLRHIELIDNFHIEQMSDNLWEINESKYCHSKREVQDYIRSQPRGSIGRETAKKMFIELERRYEDVSRV